MRYWIGGAVGLLAGALLLVGPVVDPSESVAMAAETTARAATAPAVKSTWKQERTRRLLHRWLRHRRQWNVVLVLTDDQPKGMLGDMPNLRRRIARRGVTYPNAFIPTSVCCPSRSSLLTGELAAETGVYTNKNDPRIGGYRAFKRKGNERRTFAVSLKGAGYRTGFFGKYLNHYGDSYNGRKPRGWNQWTAFATKRSGKYYRYDVTTPYSKRDRRRIANGKLPKSPRTKRIKRYSTTFFGQQAARFIRETPKSKPVLAVYAPYAPHGGFVGSSKYRGSLTDSKWWRNDPSVREDDVTDKPKWLRDRKNSQWISNWLARDPHTKQRETLRSVDDEIGRLVKVLKRTKRLKRTVFILVSDNGYAHGQHNIVAKYTPYRAATEVPLVVRYGNQLRSSAEDPRVTAANIDLTATILRAAGLAETVKGKPLTGPRPWGGVPLTGVKYGSRPPYCGWRTSSQMYVRYGSGEEEYYDYATDPYELQNRATDPSARTAVAALRKQAARACRPAPPGYGPRFSKPTWKYPTS